LASVSVRAVAAVAAAVQVRAAFEKFLRVKDELF
jgi:phage host-nuclease inhibitor protein Gam